MVAQVRAKNPGFFYFRLNGILKRNLLGQANPNKYKGTDVLLYTYSNVYKERHHLLRTSSNVYKETDGFLKAYSEKAVTIQPFIISGSNVAKKTCF